MFTTDSKSVGDTQTVPLSKTMGIVLIYCHLVQMSFSCTYKSLSYHFISIMFLSFWTQLILGVSGWSDYFSQKILYLTTDSVVDPITGQGLFW